MGLTLGEIIRRQRELTELSMRQFAAAAGISNPYLSQIERGLREPSDDVLGAIARVLRTSADSLYHEAGRGSEQPRPSAVAEAIRADPGLTARQRQALVLIYESFLSSNGLQPTRRRRARNAPAPDEPGD